MPFDLINGINGHYKKGWDKIDITASDIKKLIQARHSKDLVVTECFTGRTWLNKNLRKMDVWVMPRSWEKPYTKAFEIKISRQDFIADKKWREYLPYCNEFYFVCPWGLILPSELPDEAGLLWVSKTGTRLFQKKTPIRRDVEIPVDLYRFILINRAVISEKSVFTKGLYRS